MKASLVHRLMKRVGFEPIRKRNFNGAATSRLFSDWNVNQAGPNYELRGSLRTLRDRARDLEKNNGLVRRYLNLVEENVIGHKGMRLRAKHSSASVNKTIEQAYAEWGQPATYSMDGRMSSAAFQRAVIRAVVRDGEAFVRKVHGGPYGFGLQLMDAALIDETYTVGPDNGGTEVKLGVEVDVWNRPQAYYAFPAGVYDTAGIVNSPRIRIPASEMLHLFIPRQAGAVRGETWLAPVMVLLRHLDGYTEAEVVAARTCAAKMGFVVWGDQVDVDPDAAQKTEWEASAGIIETLDPGQKFEAWDPQHPSQNFGLFVTQITKLIAAGLNVSFAGLSSDLREVNFSSSRIGLLQERDAWRVLQYWFIEHFCDPVFDAWKMAAWASGHLPLRMTPDQYDHVWQPRGWAYTNPQQETQADMLRIAAGLTSPQRVVADEGDDLEDIYEELAAAQSLAEQMGVETYVSNMVVDPDANANGTADSAPDDGTGAGSASQSSGGGRSHPRVALIRRAS